MENNGPTSDGSNVWVPQGLLQNVRNNIYSYNPKERQSSQQERTTLHEILERPADAILAKRLVQKPSISTSETRIRDEAQTNLKGSLIPKISDSSTSLESQPTHTRASTIRRTSASSLNRTARHRADSTHSASERPARWQKPMYRGQMVSPILIQSRSESPLTVEPQHSSLTGLQEKTVPPPTSPALQGIARQDSDKVSIITITRPSRTFQRDSCVSPFDRKTLTRHSTGRSDFLADEPVRHQELRTSIFRKASIAIVDTVTKVLHPPRNTSIWNTFEKAKVRQHQLQRSRLFQLTFQYAAYLLLICFVYFVLIGRPIWGGTIWYIYILFADHFAFVGGSAIFVGLAAFYAYGSLLVFFEKPAKVLNPARTSSTTSEYSFPSAPFIRVFQDIDLEKQSQPPPKTPDDEEAKTQAVARAQTALLIPCYKSAGLLPATLEAALQIFPATNIFILANGNSPTPLDDTESVCNVYGVNHIWIPIGSKIVAQYVGCYVARKFPYCLLIDDDCLLPPEFPIVTDRLEADKSGKNSSIQCLGYTITSTGPNHSKGTWCQQAQDLEYKLSGLQRQLAGTIGSATFPHGAIVLWNTEFLIRTFKEHPGFSVSEDWFFGHVARILGSRITMCSSVFVETETPSSLFLSGGGARGGFGEMTVFKQRFKRWNFFFVNGMYYNLCYILFNWKLGFWELGAKLFVFQEVYETILYLLTPIVLPISFIVRPTYTAYLLAGTFGLYLVGAIIFNELHLRLVGQRVSRTMLLVYYMPFKLALTFVNVASCWWSLWMYAKYFAQRHPRIVEDERAVGLVLKIEEQSLAGSVADGEQDKQTLSQAELGKQRRSAGSIQYGQGLKPRRMTITALKVDVVERLAPDEIVVTNGEVITVQAVEGADDLAESNHGTLEDDVTPRDFEQLATVAEEGGDELGDEGGYSYYGV